MNQKAEGIGGRTSLELNQQNCLANISYKYCIDQ